MHVVVSPVSKSSWPYPDGEGINLSLNGLPEPGLDFSWSPSRFDLPCNTHARDYLLKYKYFITVKSCANLEGRSTEESAMTWKGLVLGGLVGLVALGSSFSYIQATAPLNEAALKGLAKGIDNKNDARNLTDAIRKINDGRQIFRFDTFGSENFWGGQLRLHEAIAGEALGGVGPGLTPAAALELGLKVDVDALPRSLRKDLR